MQRTDLSDRANALNWWYFLSTQDKRTIWINSDHKHWSFEMFTNSTNAILAAWRKQS